MTTTRTNDAIIDSHENLIATLREKQQAAERDQLAAIGAPGFLEIARRNIVALAGNVETVFNAGELTKDERIKIKQWLARAVEAVNQAAEQAARGAEQCAGAAAAYAIAVKSSEAVIAERKRRNQAIRDGVADGSIVELDTGELAQADKGTPRQPGVAPGRRIKDAMGEAGATEPEAEPDPGAETSTEPPPTPPETASKPKRKATGTRKPKARTRRSGDSPGGASKRK